MLVERSNYLLYINGSEINLWIWSYSYNDNIYGVIYVLYLIRVWDNGLRILMELAN
jgi:hypothetical protein